MYYRRMAKELRSDEALAVIADHALFCIQTSQIFARIRYAHRV